MMISLLCSLTSRDPSLCCPWSLLLVRLNKRKFTKQAKLEKSYCKRRKMKSFILQQRVGFSSICVPCVLIPSILSALAVKVSSTPPAVLDGVARSLRLFIIGAELICLSSSTSKRSVKEYVGIQS